MKKLLYKYASDCGIGCRHKTIHESMTASCTWLPCGSMSEKIGREIFCIEIVDDFIGEIERILDI